MDEIMQEIKLPFDLQIGDVIGKYVANIGYTGSFEKAKELLQKDKPIIM